jgi:hypothetical protein
MIRPTNPLTHIKRDDLTFCPGVNVIMGSDAGHDGSPRFNFYQRKIYGLYGDKHDETVSHVVTITKTNYGGALLWMEPELSTSPLRARVVADTIREFAAQGLQVFVVTNSYLLMQYLSIDVEYKKTSVPLRFTNLYRDEHGQPGVEQGKTLVDLQHNETQAALVALYEYELSLAAAYGDTAP